MDAFFSDGDYLCPISCMLRARTVLFTALAVFVLFMPLGDPKEHCASICTPQDEGKAICYLCRVYFVLVKIPNMLVDGITYLAGIIMNVLYEVMRKICPLIEKPDKQSTPDIAPVKTEIPDTAKPTEAPASATSSNYCTKCTDKGKTCVKKCPYLKAKKKEKKKEKKEEKK